MKIDDLERMESENPANLPSAERRKFLQLGLTVTGVYLGGSVLSLVSARKAKALGGIVPEPGKYSYSPHYSMVLREQLCIDCERCKDACVKTNHVPAYGFRTTILEKRRSLGADRHETIFTPVLCNHCNRPPCVRVCPTTATWKDNDHSLCRGLPCRCPCFW